MVVVLVVAARHERMLWICSILTHICCAPSSTNTLNISQVTDTHSKKFYFTTYI
jgi:hypothetical protein